MENVEGDGDVDDEGGWVDFEDGDEEEGESRNFRLKLGCCFDESDLDLKRWKIYNLSSSETVELRQTLLEIPA